MRSPASQTTTMATEIWASAEMRFHTHAAEDRELSLCALSLTPVLAMSVPRARFERRSYLAREVATPPGSRCSSVVWGLLALALPRGDLGVCRMGARCTGHSQKSI